jgi:outer membrane protein
MKLRCLVPIAVLLTIPGAAVLCADEPITLEQARAQAATRSRTLQKLLLSVDSALVDEKVQSCSFLPSITLSAGAGLSAPQTSLLEMMGISAGLSVKQTIYDGGKSSLLSRIDSLATSIARETARAQYFAVLADADAAFYGVWEASASVDAARSDLADAQVNQRLAQARLETGTIARSDFLKTEAETEAAQTSLIQAQGNLSVAERTLASLTGLPLPLKLQAIDPARSDDLMRRFAGFTEEQVATFMARLVSSAAKNNPSLSQHGLASRQAQSTVDLARAGYLPSVSATWSNALGYSAGTAAATSALSVEATLSLDMWNTKASVELKRLAARQADMDLGETQRTLDLQIERAVFDCISSSRVVSSSRKALDYAQSHYNGVLERYRLSSASVPDLSDAELLVSTNRTALVTARYRFLSAISSLRTSAGCETDDRLIALLP